MPYISMTETAEVNAIHKDLDKPNTRNCQATCHCNQITYKWDKKLLSAHEPTSAMLRLKYMTNAKTQNLEDVIISQHHDIHVTSSLSLSDIGVQLRIHCIPVDSIKTESMTLLLIISLNYKVLK